jgi:hypothetical protein
MQFIIEYMQLLAILRLAATAQQWSTSTAWVYSFIALTPLSTAGWVSTDCMLPPDSSLQTVAYVRALLFALIVPGASRRGVGARQDGHMACAKPR